MITLIILLVALIGIAIGLYFLVTRKLISPPPTTTSDITTSIFSQRCTPTLNQVDSYAATYIKDRNGNCVPNTCKPGYNLYYSKDGRFLRCSI